jgi:general secretion pathway protein F
MIFELKVYSSTGKIAALSLEAQNESEAEILAKNLGHSVLSISRKNSFQFQWLSSNQTKFALLLFGQELLSLLRAGLSIIAAIETLAEKGAGSSQELLHKLVSKLHEGQSLSTSLSGFPEVFPELFVAMVRSSEKTGSLPEALERFILYRSQLEQLRSKVITASIYPVLLIFVGALVTLFLLGYVVPKFSSIYENAGSNLPFLSRMLMEWGMLLHEHGRYVLLALVGIVGLVIYALSLKPTRRWIAQLLWRTPTLGERIHLYQLARFYRTLGMLLQGGIPLVTAMQMSADLLGESLRHQLLGALQQVREGQPLSESLQQHGLATPVSQRMMSVGEQTGNMGEMMERAAAFYDQEIARWVDWATRLFEPILMTIIGLIIGLIVILMYLPIFELADSIQ